MKFTRILHRFVILSLLLSMIAPPLSASPGIPKWAPDAPLVTLDGVRDAAYVRIASDAVGDLANPGPANWNGVAWTDMTALYVYADATTLWVYADSTPYSQSVSSGQIGLAIDVDGAQANSGGTSDPWGNAITYAYSAIDGASASTTIHPDYVVRGNIPGAQGGDDGWTELRAWDGTMWQGSGTNWGGLSGGGQIGTHIAYANGQGIEFAVPLADIGGVDPWDVHLELFGTQAGSGKGAYDTVPSDDQSNNWDDPTTQTQLASAPLAVDPAGDLANPGPATWNGVAWTDATRLHVWADARNIYVFYPSTQYTQSVSSGQFGLAIDTGPGGGASDPWGNAITFAYTSTQNNFGGGGVTTATTLLPDFVIRGNIPGAQGSDDGWTELRYYSGGSWQGGGTNWGGISGGGQSGAHIAWADGQGVRITIPRADIGVSGNQTVNLEFYGTQGGGAKGAYDSAPSDDQSNNWDDATTQQRFATFVVPDLTPPQAQHDNSVWWDGLRHDSRNTGYRQPWGAVPLNTPMVLRLRAYRNDLTAARVRVWDDRLNQQMILPMTVVGTEVTPEGVEYEYWQATIPGQVDTTVFWYRFIAIDGTDTDYYEDDATRDGGLGEPFDNTADNAWQLTVYDPAFQTPDWVKNGVLYQIFADRFFDSNTANDTPAGSFFYNEAGGSIVRSNQSNWNGVVCDPRNLAGPCPQTWSENFYGGDLAGITAKLDYLDNLGVTVLYLNPIFEAPSNHKYDTTDYGQIDDNFGTLSDYQTLIAQAHARGMKVVLDGVFNHTSSDSVYFDRYGRYAATGACEDTGSAQRGWYYFTAANPPGTGVCAGDTNYTAWFGYDSLPKLRADVSAVRDLIWQGTTPSPTSAIARYWIDLGADGWRLDVAGDVDGGVTNDPENNYWEGFRTAVHQSNPNAYIVGEEWGNASSWVLGSEWDATMNYQYGSAMLSFWRDTQFIDNDHNPASSAGVLDPLSPSQFDSRIQNWMERYPPQALYAMMNLLDSHDTSRALFMLDHNQDSGTPTMYWDQDYDWSDALARLEGVTVLQFTLPGAPTIYYGDEVGLVGPQTYDGSSWQDDPYNRQPYPWLDQSGQPYYTYLRSQANQDAVRAHYSVLANTRNAHAALRTGDFTPLLLDDTNDLLAYGRKSASDAAVVLVNRDTVTASAVSVPVAGYLPNGAQFVDVLNGNAAYSVSAGNLVVPTLGPWQSAVLVLSGTLALPPAAPTITATVASHAVGLAWSAVSGAASYDVWRSAVSGGNYSLLGSTASTVYTDTGLTNAISYYYVVRAVASNGLESVNSNEVVARPFDAINWSNLQGPAMLTTTLSAITPTAAIYGQVYIPGVTILPGQTPGLRAQVGYGPDNSTPVGNGAWTWVEMSFNADTSGNDEFVGQLIPETVGAQDYATRYTTTDGQQWLYADLDGSTNGYSPAQAGALMVLAAPDSTPPAVPTGLYVRYSSQTEVVLAWDTNTEPDLFGYELYRETANDNFVFLARVLAPTTVYTDEAVTVNGQYNYYIKALDTSFNRSAASAQVSATAQARTVQVTFLVNAPAFTPQDAPLYIAGAFPAPYPNWDPGGISMTHVSGTQWSFTLAAFDGVQIQYKYTRGAWETVEKEADGNTEVSNREMTVVYGANGTQTISDTVANWRDPLVVSATPTGTAVPVTSTVRISWSQAMTLTGVTTATLRLSWASGVIAGSYSYAPSGYVTVFTPAQALLPGTTYTVLVTGVTDVAGDVQQRTVTWTFRTAGGRVFMPGIFRNAP